MTGLLKFIFIFLLVYYGLKLITRYVVPFFAKRYIKNMQNNFNKQQHKKPYYNKSNEGDVIIKSNQRKGKKVDKDIGEYIDYEEVKDDE